MQDPPSDEVTEGSGDDVYGGHPLYRHDDEEEDIGSGADTDDYTDHHVINNDNFDNNDIVDVDDEIDPSDVDFGFDENSLSSTTKSPDTTTTKPPDTGPGDTSIVNDPHKQFNQDTNFFAQPGILTG